MWAGWCVWLCGGRAEVGSVFVSLVLIDTGCYAFFHQVCGLLSVDCGLVLPPPPPPPPLPPLGPFLVLVPLPHNLSSPLALRHAHPSRLKHHTTLTGLCPSACLPPSSPSCLAPCLSPLSCLSSLLTSSTSRPSPPSLFHIHHSRHITVTPSSPLLFAPDDAIHLTKGEQQRMSAATRQQTAGAVSIYRRRKCRSVTR